MFVLSFTCSVCFFFSVGVLIAVESYVSYTPIWLYYVIYSKWKWKLFTFDTLTPYAFHGNMFDHSFLFLIPFRFQLPIIFIYETVDPFMSECLMFNVQCNVGSVDFVGSVFRIYSYYICLHTAYCLPLLKIQPNNSKMESAIVCYKWQSNETITSIFHMNNIVQRSTYRIELHWWHYNG